MSTSSPSTALTTIWTIGHSARRLEEFLRLFAEFHIDAIAAVRSFPGSRKCPRYGKDVLSTTVTGTRSAITGCPHLVAVDESRVTDFVQSHINIVMRVTCPSPIWRSGRCTLALQRRSSSRDDGQCPGSRGLLRRFLPGRQHKLWQHSRPPCSFNLSPKGDELDTTRHFRLAAARA
jgi:hypothetical protein